MNWPVLRAAMRLSQYSSTRPMGGPRGISNPELLSLIDGSCSSRSPRVPGSLMQLLPMKSQLPGPQERNHGPKKHRFDVLRKKEHAVREGVISVNDLQHIVQAESNRGKEKNPKQNAAQTGHSVAHERIILARSCVTLQNRESGTRTRVNRFHRSD